VLKGKEDIIRVKMESKPSKKEVGKFLRELNAYQICSKSISSRLDEYPDIDQLEFENKYNVKITEQRRDKTLSIHAINATELNNAVTSLRSLKVDSSFIGHKQATINLDSDKYPEIFKLWLL
jgi:hypothetical protein